MGRSFRWLWRWYGYCSAFAGTDKYHSEEFSHGFGKSLVDQHPLDWHHHSVEVNHSTLHRIQNMFRSCSIASRGYVASYHETSIPKVSFMRNLSILIHVYNSILSMHAQTEKRNA